MKEIWRNRELDGDRKRGKESKRQGKKSDREREKY